MTTQHTPDCGGEDAPWCSRACVEAAEARAEPPDEATQRLLLAAFGSVGDTPDTP